MGKNRIIYKNWATDRNSTTPPDKPDHDSRADLITAEVHVAISKLEPLERTVIERYYLQFEDLTDIAASLNLSVYRIESIHARALKKLRKLLGQFVEEQFGLRRPLAHRCPICQSTQRAAIESFISSRDRKRPWRILFRQLRTRFGLDIHTHHLIQSHQRYH